MGIAHGLFCVGCCWSLMLVMFAVGLGSLAWMLVLGVVMAIEKNLPWGRRLTRPLGVVLILAGRGSAVAAWPAATAMLAAMGDADAGRRQPRRAPRPRERRHPRADPRRRPQRACSRTATRACRRGASPRLADVPLSQIHYHFGSQAAAHPRRPRGRERAAARSAGDDVRRPGAALAPVGARLRLPRGRPRVGLRPDPPGDDRGRLVRPEVAGAVRER